MYALCEHIKYLNLNLVVINFNASVVYALKNIIINYLLIQMNFKVLLKKNLFHKNITLISFLFFSVSYQTAFAIKNISKCKFLS